MDTLYILGNGFDIAHGISTNYWDFRQYLQERDWEFLYLALLYKVQIATGTFLICLGITLFVACDGGLKKAIIVRMVNK